MALVSISISVLSLSGCGGEEGPSSSSTVAVVPAATDVVPPAPTPTPTPSSSATASPAGESEATAVDQLGAIASNFDIASELVPAWGTGAIPQSAARDTVGAFRFICNASHEARDDPIVYPGQPGRSHLHQFFGNTLTNANSTFASLRTTGASTCMSPLNRSAYWMPTMMNGKGKVVRPDYVSIYYKRMPASDPNCRRQGIACVALPRGLRFIFGYDMISAEAPTGSFTFQCVGNNGATVLNEGSSDIAAAARNCPAGYQLEAKGNAPDCWDGVNVDSANHRDHVAYGSFGNWGYYRCPSTHPYVIPAFTMAAFYTVDADLDRTGKWDGTMNSWHFSSDEMMGSSPGTTFHTDFFSAWDDSIEKIWTDNCLDKMLNCSGGDLGNGKQLKMNAGFSWIANPRIVAPPS